MKEHTITVQSSIEARLVALFVQTASKFDSSIYVKINNKTVNAKSVMGMISLGILEGQQITIIAEGKDENEAVDALNSFLQNMNNF